MAVPHQRKKALILWCWICPCWTPEGKDLLGTFLSDIVLQGAVLCSGKRAHQYLASGRQRELRRQRPGILVRPAAQTAAGRFSSGIPAMEKRCAYRYGGGPNVQNAVVHVPLPGRDLRKCPIVVTDTFLQKSVPFCKARCGSQNNNYNLEKSRFLCYRNTKRCLYVLDKKVTLFDKEGHAVGNISGNTQYESNNTVCTDTIW